MLDLTSNKFHLLTSGFSLNVKINLAYIIVIKCKLSLFDVLWPIQQY